MLIGACSAFIAVDGYIATGFFALTIVAIGLGSAGCNGLTNYLDREVDAKMARTQNRVLPSKRIDPPQKALPLIISLIIIALSLAWILNPLCFIIGCVGVAASAIWRKTISCTFFGIIAGCSPVLIGWFAMNTEFNIKILLICLLVALWIPVHVWSVMIARRDEYFKAGLKYFPLNLKVKTVVVMLLILSILLYIVSNVLFVQTDLRYLYLIVANILGIYMIYANARLLRSTTSEASWKVYKLSSFPYLGVIFLVMCLDIWLR